MTGTGPLLSLAAMAGGEITTARAAVTFDAPHGREVVVLHDGAELTFGRGGSCDVRFGFAPEVDEGVPRIAGRLVAAAQRVFVEAGDAARRPTVQITAEGRPAVMVGVGDGFAPAERTFRVGVVGARQTWWFTVRVRREPFPVDGDGSPPTRSFDVQLSPLQRRVLEAYMAPMRRGRWEPATHREVATALSYHPNTVREALYEVWSKLFAAGVALPDIADKRLAVTEALRLHRLLDSR